MALHIAKRLLRTHGTTPTVALFSAVDRSFSSTSSDLIRATLFPCDGIGPEIAESVKQVRFVFCGYVIQLYDVAPMYGIAVAALGMPSTIATGLAIHAYGPISDNAGGIAEMAGMSHRIRERTDALDAAGNATAAIEKVALVPGDAFGDDCCIRISYAASLSD
ncbi:putative inorganic diphosphatase [Helianthus annuus]|nr:putative inorganic diphosphatase [Helianthus annuus]KAJ0471642.1 putative inorganic diphosphatase [Helianthus annuus]KAJ0647282.1 putative inorganic diphosphatase [Helianthus annuus]KAJ0651168.1 putative inorganic diphosphatase [Helianthus annuus]KAJ0843032.1 putative inorganic diphosphatase [Helianthus annuus]